MNLNYSPCKIKFSSSSSCFQFVGLFLSLLGPSDMLTKRKKGEAGEERRCEKGRERERTRTRTRKLYFTRTVV